MIFNKVVGHRSAGHNKMFMHPCWPATRECISAQTQVKSKVMMGRGKESRSKGGLILSASASIHALRGQQGGSLSLVKRGEGGLTHLVRQDAALHPLPGQEQ